MIKTGLSLCKIKTGLYPVKVQSDVVAPRDRLLDTAGRLFYQYGFHAIGIDRILAESGVAKMTLYRHFSSKEALISAYLERADAQFWAWAEAAMSKAQTPDAKLIALFDAAARLATSPDCLGCIFQGAAAAFPELDHPAHQIAIRHKTAVRMRMEKLARAARLRKPEKLGKALALLLDGVWVSARMFGPDNPSNTVGDTVRALIAAHRG